MANTISGFYQTLVTAVTDAARLLAPTWNMSRSIYWDYKPEAATIGQTLNVPIPSDPTANVADIGAGDMQLTDIAFTPTPIVFDKHPQGGYTVRDFEQFNSPEDIRRIFLDAQIKGVQNNINAQITALITTGNFTTNSAISCTGHVVTLPQFLQGMGVLIDQRVPVNDRGNMSMVLPGYPYTTMMDATTGNAGAAWVQAFIAGSRTAEAVRNDGEFPTSFNTDFKYDQQMPTTGTAPSRTFTAAYLHRWAIAGVSRPLPNPVAEGSSVVEVMFQKFGDIMLRIMFGYNQLKAGWVVTIDAGYGLKVVRENMCQLFSIAE